MTIYKGYTQQQNKATQKYKSTNYDRLTIWVKKGEKDKYKELAKSKGYSLNEYIKVLLKRDSI